MSAAGGDDNLNLTPFIDLFSTLICFLLMTAVWNTISALSTNVENSTSASEPQPEPKDKKVELSITLYQDKVQFMEATKPLDIPLLGANLDENKIIGQLRIWKAKYPDRKDIVLNSANNTAYGKMISLFDMIVGEDFPEVGVNTQ
jgi:biopolymer transport protein ExbD